MKIIITLVLAVGLSVSPFQSALAGYVHGYTKSNGTYVNGYYRSNPDGNPYNNYSFPGNTNPYTGVTAGGNASTYLNNYYDRSSSGSSYTPSYNTYTPAPTCPINSYSSGSSCKCDYGYVVSGGSCVTGDSQCHTQLGIMSSYDSLSNSCKCDSGYVIGSLGFCAYKSIYSDTYSAPAYSYGNSESSCPAHSSGSPTDSTKCSCSAGYQVNKDKTKCIKITAKANDKICSVAFSSKSKWNGEYSEEGTPYCICKTSYEWNKKQTACIKSE